MTFGSVLTSLVDQEIVKVISQSKWREDRFSSSCCKKADKFKIMSTVVAVKLLWSSSCQTLFICKLRFYSRCS